MSADNLTGQYISDTFRKILQLSDNGSYITDGTGSVVNTIPVTASWAQTASYALNAVGTITNAINAETASYSTTLGASLDNTTYSTPDTVYLVSSDNSILSSVVIDGVLNSYNTDIAARVQISGPELRPNLWLSFIDNSPGFSSTGYVTVDTAVSYNSSSKVLNVTSSYAQTASFYQESDPIFTAKSASLATTGSNTFKGNQTVSGSIVFESFASPPTPTPGALYFDGTNLYLGV